LSEVVTSSLTGSGDEERDVSVCWSHNHKFSVLYQPPKAHLVPFHSQLATSAAVSSLVHGIKSAAFSSHAWNCNCNVLSVRFPVKDQAGNHINTKAGQPNCTLIFLGLVG
jgi:hypothetical protein